MGIQDVFAINMRNCRKAAGMTQEELAEKSGLHRTYIGGIEQRRINVSLRNVEKIARALDIDPAQLFLHASDCPSGVSEPGTTYRVGDYVLGAWTEEGLALTPLEVENVDLSVQILSSLVADGYTGRDLAEHYRRAQSELVSFFRQQR